MSAPEPAPRRIVPEPASDPMSTLIPYKNGKALAAYYCGVFSLIPCFGAILGPIALALGLMGLTYANEHPGAKGKGHAIAGIVLGSITTLGNWGLVAMVLLTSGFTALQG